ncbi:hypothetical protein HMPREF9004_0647 [Schaalia cardiffensis F0333]|uniref:Uncharacterized protein n=1 Tax=Schaalia cardiffensis F0333 TaxID=888050 RepID=N6XBN0_9ACTO|nr:hypothetical protein HMPREF9004_0647 [Schaalia cardiffensis F0333]
MLSDLTKETLESMLANVLMHLMARGAFRHEARYASQSPQVS